MATQCYCVTFYKTVTTDYGRDREITQRAVEVRASNERSAVEIAKTEFCRLHGVADWSWHSDRFEIEKLS